jgi:hypothetical protein
MLWAGGGSVNQIGGKLERGRFLKKAAQKLSGLWARGARTPQAQITDVFLLLFVHKK